MKNIKAWLTASLLSLTLITSPAMAVVKIIVLPADAVQLKPSPLPGYVKAQGNCVACHSAEYMLYQPPTAPRAYWDAMVKRMKSVFKAPLNDADTRFIRDIADERRTALTAPRQLTRFLCGLTSPATTRAKLGKHAGFGRYATVPFRQVHARVEEVMGKEMLASER